MDFTHPRAKELFDELVKDEDLRKLRAGLMRHWAEGQADLTQQELIECLIELRDGGMAPMPITRWNLFHETLNACDPDGEEWWIEFIQSLVG